MYSGYPVGMSGVQFKIREKGIGGMIGADELDAVREVLENAESLANQWGGVYTRKFEEEFARYCGVKHAVALSSCMAALTLSTDILRLNKGDEVICTPQTFIATVIEAVKRGVVIKFADIDPDTLNVNPNTIEDKITQKTRAIFIVPYGGMPVDMDPVMKIARMHNLKVVEDAAPAVGASYKDRKVGSIADMSCFSFHSLKNMTTLGEGGMLTTNSDEYAEEARRLRSFGIVGKMNDLATKAIGPHRKPEPPLRDHADGAYDFNWATIEEHGTNFRMTEVQAAVGSVQLKKLDHICQMRIRVAREYDEGLASIRGIRISKNDKSFLNVYHQYLCFLDQEKARIDHTKFLQFLMYKKNIQTVLRYFPLHITSYMRYYGHDLGECPVCEKVWFEEQINLPIDPSKTEEEIQYVIASIEEGIKSLKS